MYEGNNQLVHDPRNEAKGDSKVWKMYEDNNQLVHDPRNEATIRLRRIKTNLCEYKKHSKSLQLLESARATSEDSHISIIFLDITISNMISKKSGL